MKKRKDFISWGELKVLKTKKFYKVLLKWYGLNWKTINNISNFLMISPFININLLTNDHHYWLSRYFSINMLYFTKFLKKKIRKNKKFYLKLGLIRGLRLKQCLPIRGQRTHTNANTMLK